MSGEPLAYAVFLPPGSEYEYLVFTEKQQAEDKADMILQDIIDETGVEPYSPEADKLRPEVIPLVPALNI